MCRRATTRTCAHLGVWVRGHGAHARGVRAAVGEHQAGPPGGVCPQVVALEVAVVCTGEQQVGLQGACMWVQVGDRGRGGVKVRSGVWGGKGVVGSATRVVVGIEAKAQERDSSDNGTGQAMCGWKLWQCCSTNETWLCFDGFWGRPRSLHGGGGRAAQLTSALWKAVHQASRL